jgi:hypothetical protein
MASNRARREGFGGKDGKVLCELTSGGGVRTFPSFPSFPSFPR